jgi:hypothetical protein
MSNRRDLKKDIDYLIAEVLSDCFIFSEVHQGEKNEEVSAIITDAVELRNDLIARVNNPDGRDNPKILKTYYQSVVKDLYAGADQLFERLSSLSSGKK